MSKEEYWTIIRHSEVTKYLIPADEKLRAQRKSLRQAIASLQKGVPKEAERINDVTKAYRWDTENHTIRFQVTMHRKQIYVTVVEPVNSF